MKGLQTSTCKHNVDVETKWLKRNKQHMTQSSFAKSLHYKANENKDAFSILLGKWGNEASKISCNKKNIRNSDIKEHLREN